MKIVLGINMIMIILLFLDRLAVVSGGRWIDILFFALLAAGMSAYFMAVVLKIKMLGYISAPILLVNLIVFCGYGVYSPLGSYLYSLIYCILMFFIFLPGVYFSLRVTRLPEGSSRI